MAVKDVWKDDDNFVVNLEGAGWGIVYAFPIKELAEGASLSRMMNEKVRKTLKYYGGLLSKAELREVAKGGVSALRDLIEPYFESRGVGA